MLDPHVVQTNFAVNNDSDYYPRVNVSHTGQHSSPAKLIDGNMWYHVHPPNRWPAADSKNERDWVEHDLGTLRKIHTIKLYFLDDTTDVVPPKACEIEYWREDRWQPLPNQQRTPDMPSARRANMIRIPEMEIAFCV